MKAGRNVLLAKLPANEQAAIAALFETVELRQRDILHEPLQPIEHLYFLDAGFSSDVVIDAGGETIEVGCVGREGFTGTPLILGAGSSPHRSFMETDGRASRISRVNLAFAMGESPTFSLLLFKFVHVFMIQIASTALADGRYGIQERIARWLLMCHDRMDGNDLPLTHDFLSLMLGVRRASVTDALHLLEGHGAIRGTRGLIIVRSRSLLKEIAGHCYGLPEAEYQRIMTLG